MFKKYSLLFREEYLVRLRLLAVIKNKKIYELVDEAIERYLQDIEEVEKEEKNN